MAKSLACDPCEEETPAAILIQDVRTGDSLALCDTHYALHSMSVAEAWAQEQMSQEDTKSDEQREVYDDPGPKPLIREPEETTGNERGNDSVPNGGENEKLETESTAAE